MKKAKACYADGGVIGPDGLTDAQRAKKNAALQGLGMSTTAPAPQQPATAPVPAPAPQPSATGQGILGIIGNRGKQIDKAAGYAYGGKPEGGIIKGIGTPTSDSIDAGVRETGEQIKVSTGERIVSKAQDKLLQRLAKAMGYESLDAYLEAGTGKPVGPTIKDGKIAAADGLRPWYEKDPLASLTESMRSSDKANEQLKSLYPAGTFNDSTKSSPAPEAQNTPDPVIQGQLKKPVGFDNPAGVGQKISDIPVPGSKFVTGGAPDGISPVARGGFFEAGTTPPSSAQGGFTQGNKSYNVNDTSQQGISRITATGANPLYTNIKPEDAVSGLSKQPVQTGQPSVQPPVQQDTKQPEGIARIERANQIRGEMIDSAIKANGGNGVGILNTEQTLPGGMSISDWNNRVSSGFNTQMSPKEKAAYLTMEGSQAIQRTGQDLLNQQAAARNALEARGQDLRSAREVDRDQVVMRGQDINALGDKAKLAMLERNDQRQAEQSNLQRRISEGQLADSEAQRSARTAMAAALEKGDTEGYKQAVKQATIAGIKFDGEKSPKFAEIADPNDKSGLRKIPVQYNSDGTYTVMKPAASSGAVSVPKTGEVRDGYRFKGGDPSKQSSWEKI